jgi:hypothetical protein
MINSAWSAVQLNPALVIDYKQKDGTGATLNKQQIEAVAGVVVNHVQSCFSKEKYYYNLIKNASTYTEVLSIDFTQDWLV